MDGRYYKRELEAPFLEALQQFPAVMVTGARQAGKSTFLQHCLPGYTYVTLDSPRARAMALADPELFFEAYPAPVVIDEIQYAPSLLSYLKMRIDADRDRCGQFVLTGSQVFQLMAGVSESLAGRVAIFHLYPFSWQEVEGVPGRAGSSGDALATMEQTVQGFYPELLKRPNINRELWYESYLATYLERDVRSLRAIKELSRFQTFLRLLAMRAGGLLNLSEVGKECGISQTTAKDWLTVLEATYVVYLLRPYYHNHGKRLVKSPKLYFVDTGLLCHLLGIERGDQLLKGADGGRIFENMVVMEKVKRASLSRQKVHLYFYRTHKGAEVDLLMERGGVLYPCEIKLSKTPQPGMASSLQAFIQDHKGTEGVVLCLQPEEGLLARGVKAKHWSAVTIG
ncbi:MAG: ATP-binding protein [Parachlamydiales bacterium]